LLPQKGFQLRPQFGVVRTFFVQKLGTLFRRKREQIRTEPESYCHDPHALLEFVQND
jgi:hypothetical protein